MTTIGQRIKERRTDLNMTQEELAKKLGYSHKSSIGKIENGNNDITQSKVVEFARALDTTVAYLMGWDEEEDQVVRDANIQRMISIAEQLTKDQQSTLIEQMEFILWKNKEKSTQNTTA